MSATADQAPSDQAVALYTCAAWPELWEDDRLLLPALARVGLRGVPVVWDDPAASPPALGLIRSTWDYYLRLPAFLAFLEERSAERRLFNPLPLLRWNLDKRYLLQLAELGVPIIPTRVLPALTQDALPALWRELGELVLKPTVSAGSWRTLRLAPGDALPEGPVGHGRGARADIPDAEPAGYLAQPFLPQISEGELSFVFFDGEFSHAARKRPRPGDFRVQEQYGGTMEALAAPPALRDQAQAVLQALRAVPQAAGAPPLYARVDGVLVEGRLLLMELELIEPSLYLALADGAADRLAQALRRRL